jgi:hypothetical protein
VNGPVEYAFPLLGLSRHSAAFAALDQCDDFLRMRAEDGVAAREFDRLGLGSNRHDALEVWVDHATPPADEHAVGMVRRSELRINGGHGFATKNGMGRRGAQRGRKR